MAYEVVDQRGRVRKLRDHEIVPDGYSLRIPTRFADSRQRAAAASTSDPFPITDVMRERCAVAREEWLMRLDSTMHRHRVKLTDADAAAIADAMDDPHFDAGAEAYSRYKKRLGTHKRYANVSTDPPWQRLQPRLKTGLGTGYDSAADALPAHVNPRDAAAVAYERRNARLRDAWRKGKGAGLPVSVATGPSPEWSSDGRPPPAVGSFAKTSGYSPYQTGK